MAVFHSFFINRLEEQIDSSPLLFFVFNAFSTDFFVKKWIKNSFGDIKREKNMLDIKHAF